VLQHRRPSHWDLFIVNPDGSGYAPLTRPTTVLVDSLPSNVAPAWSPDGQQIVFLSNRTPENSAGAWGVWVMNADGSNQRRLPIDLSFDYGFAEEQMLDWGP
jgi:Tol biopolymer transport system component